MSSSYIGASNISTMQLCNLILKKHSYFSENNEWLLKALNRVQGDDFYRILVHLDTEYSEFSDYREKMEQALREEDKDKFLFALTNFSKEYPDMQQSQMLFLNLFLERSILKNNVNIDEQNYKEQKKKFYGITKV